MELAKTILSSKNMQKWIDQNLDGLSYPQDLRHALSLSCLDMVIEHYKAIVELINLHLKGSALSLSRLAFESYVRGVWLFYCASEAELESYQRDKFNKKFHELISEVEKIDGFDCGVLSKAKDISWKGLNSFTHSGIAQLSRRYSGTIHSPSYSEKELILTINHAKALALMAVYSIALIAKDKRLEIAVDELAKMEL